MEIPDLMCACATARRAARALTQLYDGRLRAHGVEVPQFALMSMLHANGPTTQATMGRRFGLDKTTLSRNLRVLERKGWIEVAAGDDARERRTRLTAAGRRRLAAARPAWRDAQTGLKSAMSAADWTAMWKTLRAITAAAHAAQRRRIRKPKRSAKRGTP